MAADMPHANRLTVGIMAMVADEERRMISARTKAALAAAKRRGVKLGGDRGGRLTAKARAARRAVQNSKRGGEPSISHPLSHVTAGHRRGQRAAASGPLCRSRGCWRWPHSFFDASAAVAA